MQINNEFNQISAESEIKDLVQINPLEIYDNQMQELNAAIFNQPAVNHAAFDWDKNLNRIFEPCL